MNTSRSSGILARLSIAQKLVLLFLINVVVAGTISVVSISYLTSISHELEQIAYEDIPLTRQLTQVSAHQLEQVIHLERALRYGELLTFGQPTESELDKEVSYFEDLTGKIRADITLINTMVSEFLQKDHSTEVIDEFRHVQATMNSLAEGQTQITTLAADTFELLRAGNLQDALVMVESLTALEDKLENLITTLLIKFEEFTAESMTLASEHEVEAKRNVLVLSVWFILLASIVSFLVYRSVAIPLRHIKNSLVALEDTETRPLPDLDEKSEIGKIYHSIAVIGNIFNAINRTQASIFVGSNGTIERANSRFLEILDCGMDAIEGKPFSSLLCKETGSALLWDKQWESAVNGEPVSGEYELSTDSGKSCWIQATISPIVGINGKISRVVIYGNDITKEVSNRAEIAMISLVASKTDNSVVITDANQRIEYVNEGFTRVTGYSADEAIGKVPGMLLQGQDTDKNTIARIREKISAREPFYDEILNYNKAGQPYWVSLAINPVFDEFGHLIRFVSIQGEVTENKLRALENERGMHESVAVLNGLAQGKLNNQMSGEYQGTFDEISGAINETVSTLVGVVQRIRTVASKLDIAAQEINNGNADLTRRSERAAASLEETSSSMEEITTTVAQNADNSAQANELALGAHEEAEKGGAIVGQAVDAMVEINESSKKIADITGVIDDIAFQTNLLALNASVEAARAGEQGRGFAVVASEVRNLAGRSADAAKEIKELIVDSVKRVENGVALVNQTGETLDGIVTQVKKVADIVAEINIASQEQAHGVKVVHNAIVQIDDTTRQNVALVEQASAASQSTTNQAQHLIQLIEFFDTSGVANTSFSNDNDSSEADKGNIITLPASDQSYRATGSD